MLLKYEIFRIWGSDTGGYEEFYGTANGKWKVVPALVLSHSVLWANQRELTCCLSFPSCSLHNPKFRQTDYCRCYLLHAGILLSLLFEPEDGGDMFL